ncbi:MAG: hypothetical protein AAF742_03770 [Pseudomonadota bacterium]
MTSPDSIKIINAVMIAPLFLLGISHIAQPRMWVEIFNDLASKGNTGVIWRTFLFELWPAILIVVFHQVWTFPGVILTAYGHLLLFKVALSLTLPSIGLRSLQQADKTGTSGFIAAGVVLIGLAALCAYQTALAFP